MLISFTIGKAHSLGRARNIKCVILIPAIPLPYLMTYMDGIQIRNLYSVLPG
jgi:hypothetical protein